MMTDVNKYKKRTYSDLGYHHLMHQAFALAPHTLVFSYTRAQIHVSSSQKPTPYHTARGQYIFMLYEY